MRAMFPDVPILDMTATSTAAVTKDVKVILKIPLAIFFMAGYNMPYLKSSRGAVASFTPPQSRRWTPCNRS